MLLESGPAHPQQETEEQASDHIRACEATAEFVSAMGGTLAPDKSRTLATTAPLRACLRKKRVGDHEPYQVLTHVRDLGAHLAVGARQVAPTLTARLQAGVGMVKRAATMRLPEERLASVIRGKVIPASTYGAPTSAVAVGPLTKLRSTIVEAVDQKAASNRSVEGTLMVGRVDLDPATAIIQSRITTFRRQWHKAPELRPIFDEVYAQLAASGHSGTCPEEGEPRIWALASEGAESGPVSLMLKSCADLGAWVAPGWILHTVGKPPFDLIRSPVQYLKPYVRDLAAQVRARAHFARFEFGRVAGTFDRVAWLRALTQSPNRRLTSRVASDGLWTQDR
eukprot:14332132-Alexandrium_andersonii.AAC.1